MVQPEHEELSVRQQCALLHLARSNLYYQPVEADAEELVLMRQIDRLYLEHPYYGSRRMQVVLRQQGLLINRKRVQRLMRLMVSVEFCLEALEEALGCCSRSRNPPPAGDPLSPSGRNSLPGGPALHVS